MVFLTLAFTGCFPDDYNGLPYAPTDTGPGVTTVDTGIDSAPTLVGSWVSEGDDLSPLFAGVPFRYVTVDATFSASGSYVVTIVDADGLSYVTEGTYTIDDNTDPATVSQSQTEPYVAEAAGIWTVVGNTLTYEVVQTVPDYGFLPPTPADGFGSTAGPGLDGGVNVQVYRTAP